LRHRLLRQPDGFEGLLLGAEHRHPRDLSVDHGVEDAEGAIDLGAAALATPCLSRSHHYRPGAEIGQSLHLILIPLERPDPAAHEYRDALSTMDRLLISAGARDVQDDMGIEE